jgi:DNA-binding MarR family transcriptional regulator
MDGRSTEEIRDELEELMREQIESLKAQTFGGLSEEELREQQERLKRIRELSADFLSALKKSRSVDRRADSD